MLHAGSRGIGNQLAQGTPEFDADLTDMLWAKDADKDIDQVMADQADLVEVLHTLHQALSYKGT